MSTALNRRVGIEIESESETISSVRCHRFLQENSTLWEFDPNEGSLRNGGWEIKTIGRGVPCQQALDSLHDIYPVLQGSTGTWRAAIHTHVDVRDMSAQARALAFAVAACVDNSLFQLVSPERVESNFCIPLFHRTPAVVTGLRTLWRGVDQVAGWHKYTSVNLQPLRTFGTMEFRHMRTPKITEDPESIRDGIEAISTFVDKAVRIVEYGNNMRDGVALPKVLNAERIREEVGLAPDLGMMLLIKKALGAKSNKAPPALVRMYPLRSTSPRQDTLESAASVSLRQAAEQIQRQYRNRTRPDRSSIAEIHHPPTSLGAHEAEYLTSLFGAGSVQRMLEQPELSLVFRYGRTVGATQGSYLPSRAAPIVVSVLNREPLYTARTDGYRVFAFRGRVPLQNIYIPIPLTHAPEGMDESTSLCSILNAAAGAYSGIRGYSREDFVWMVTSWLGTYWAGSGLSEILVSSIRTGMPISEEVLARTGEVSNLLPGVILHEAGRSQRRILITPPPALVRRRASRDEHHLRLLHQTNLLSLRVVSVADPSTIQTLQENF